MMKGLTAVDGIKVGHHTLTARPTGCTVILAEQGATAGVDVRGSAPGTRETDLLNPINLVQQVHAIVLAGGSALGIFGGPLLFTDASSLSTSTRTYLETNVASIERAYVLGGEVSVTPTTFEAVETALGAP